MPASRSDRILDEWRAVARTVRRPDPRRGLTVRSSLPLAMGSVGLLAVLLVALLISQRPASTAPGPAASGALPTVVATAEPSATALASPAAELQARVIASIPGIWSTDCFSEQPAVTDGALWLVPVGGTSLARIDTTANQVVAEIPLGIGPSPQVVAAEGAVWVAPGNCEAGTPQQPMVVKRIDPATNQIVATVSFDAPGFLVASGSGVWVTIRTNPYTTYRLDPATNEATRVFESDGRLIAACGGIWTAAPTADSTSVQVQRLDPATGTAGHPHSIEGSTIASLVAAGDECWAAVPIEGPEPVVPTPAYLARIDPSAGSVIRSPDLPSTPFELNGTVWLRSDDPATRAFSIQQIDPRSGGPLGPTWNLPADVGSAGLWYANGSIWAQVGSTLASAGLVRLDIPVVHSEASPAPAATPDTQASPSLTAGEFALPTRPPNSNGGGDALLAGILGGSVRDGVGCLWLEEHAPNGSVAGLASIIWPYGYRAFVDPLRVVGPDGRTIATVGDRIEMGGGAPPLDYTPTPAQDPCGLGQVVSVSGVVSVNGR
jgi:hypothetical protein